MAPIPEHLRWNWIPYIDRTKQQRRLTNEFHEEIGRFPLLGTEVGIPDRVILHELEIKATGKLLPRIRQLSGSCVGAGGARSYCHAQCGDVIHRGDAESILLPFPWATYGVGREIGGMKRTGEGSFGAAQAKAVAQFGMLPWDHFGMPAPTIKNGWAQWTSNIEVSWSHPSGWPINRRELEPEANKYRMQTVTQATSPDDMCQAIAQGYGCTMACMFGTKPRVEHDVLLGRWNDSWAHQQCISGYWKHPQLGLIFACDNQWGDMHGSCPTLSQLGVNGSYWILESDIKKVLKQDGEIYLHSNTMGFPARTIDWGTMGICS